jgi:hypothetical protein
MEFAPPLPIAARQHTVTLVSPATPARPVSGVISNKNPPFGILDLGPPAHRGTVQPWSNSAGKMGLSKGSHKVRTGDAHAPALNHLRVRLMSMSRIGTRFSLLVIVAFPLIGLSVASLRGQESAPATLDSGPARVSEAKVKFAHLPPAPSEMTCTRPSRLRACAGVEPNFRK